MFCKHCGKEVPEDANFCPYCQKPVEPTHIQGTEAFGRSNQTKYMVFTLGLVLLLVGFFMVTHSVTVTRYRDYYEIPVPYQATEYPFRALGTLLAIAGVAAVGAAFTLVPSSKPATRREGTPYDPLQQ